MARLKLIGKSLGIMMFALLVFPVPAYAYLDPGTGSYIFQILVGAVLGGLFVLKMFWGKVKSFLASIFSNKSKG